MAKAIDYARADRRDAQRQADHDKRQERRGRPRAARPASKRQLAILRGLARTLDTCIPDKLTARQAGDLIDRWKRRKAAASPDAALRELID